MRAMTPPIDPQTASIAGGDGCPEESAEGEVILHGIMPLNLSLKDRMQGVARAQERPKAKANSSGSKVEEEERAASEQ